MPTQPVQMFTMSKNAHRPPGIRAFFKRFPLVFRSWNCLKQLNSALMCGYCLQRLKLLNDLSPHLSIGAELPPARVGLSREQRVVCNDNTASYCIATRFITRERYFWTSTVRIYLLQKESVKMLFRMFSWPTVRALKLFTLWSTRIAERYWPLKFSYN